MEKLLALLFWSTSTEWVICGLPTVCSDVNCEMLLGVLLPSVIFLKEDVYTSPTLVRLALRKLPTSSLSSLISLSLSSMICWSDMT